PDRKILRATRPARTGKAASRPKPTDRSPLVVGAGSSSPPPAIPSGGAARSMGLGSSPIDERSRARQDNADLGVVAGLRVNLYRPRMLLHDNVVGDGEAEAGSFSGRLSREEGIEHLFPHFRWNARTVVANSYLNFVA